MSPALRFGKTTLMLSIGIYTNLIFAFGISSWSTTVPLENSLSFEKTIPILLTIFYKKMKRILDRKRSAFFGKAFWMLFFSILAVSVTPRFAAAAGQSFNVGTAGNWN